MQISILIDKILILLKQNKRKIISLIKLKIKYNLIFHHYKLFYIKMIFIQKKH